MARYINEIQTSADPRITFEAISQYLTNEGYEYLTYQGENLFKKGHGLLAGPTFIKISFSPNTVRLEAWVKFAILPGVYAGEMDTNGAMGFAIKEKLRQRVEYIERAILGVGANYAPIQQPPVVSQPTYQSPVAPQPAVQQPYAPKKVFCTRCGTESTGARFCRNCGNSIV